jgi:RNase H-fold protein (predicted Holliday junction resolvase)
MPILAIDPGRDKCGLIASDGATILDRTVVAIADLAKVLQEWGTRYHIDQVVLGDRTGGEVVQRLVAAQFPGVPIALVREANTTLLARRRYFADHPPKGWRRFVPVSMQVPPKPYDDYAAEVLLTRFRGDVG